MGEVTNQDLHRVQRWKALRDVALEFTKDNFGAMREGMSALQEIKDDNLWREGGYESWVDCGIKLFGVTPKVEGFLGSAIRQLESAPHGGGGGGGRGASASPPSTPSETVIRSQASFREIGASIKGIQESIESLATTDFGVAIRTGETGVFLNNASAALRDAMPAGICGWCKSGDPCEKCGGRGWLPLSLYKHMPADLIRDLTEGGYTHED